MADPTPEQHLALRAVAERYAAGVDRRDLELFLSAFHPDGTLQVFNPTGTDQPGRLMDGHDAIARVIPAISRYDATYHLLGNSRFEIDGDEARGEVYCLAHHRTRSADGQTNHVMYIRYDDRYQQRAGVWRITTRRVQVDWTEDR